jgi:glycosyltransferase involved in cell wall biosynthesis
MKISVIIPTYNRKSILQECLQSLLNQSISTSDYEILVISDGSDDGTKEFMADFIKAHKNVFYFAQNKKGPSSARNVGIRQARGKYLLFTGDDIIASGDLLKEHLYVLETREDAAFLGLTLWDNAINISPFMKFIVSYGHQFDYAGLEQGQYCPWGLFYTSNVSVGRSLVLAELFDEDFPYPTWEDCELGYRLSKKGIKIVFNKKALAFHHHVITEEEFYKKVRQSGISRICFYKKHPELITPQFLIAKNKFALYFSKGLYMCAEILRSLGLHNLYWQLGIWRHTILGIHEGLRSHNSQQLPASTF